MSLQVWLPLNKENDFRNRGAGKITNVNISATYNSLGKIGGCYIGSLSFRPRLNNSAFISEAFWVNFPSTSSLVRIFGSEGNEHFPFIYISNTQIKFIDHNDYGTETISYSFTPNTWYHICLVHTNDNNILYVNGTKIHVSIKLVRCVNRSSPNRLVFGNTNIKINDLRLYDHPLSSKEVEDISRGLVLHYPLNQEGVRQYYWNQLIPDSNLPSNSTEFILQGSAVQNNGSYIITATSTWNNGLKYDNFLNIPGHQYLLRTRIKNDFRVQFKVGTNAIGNNSDIVFNISASDTIRQVDYIFTGSTTYPDGRSIGFRFYDQENAGYTITIETFNVFDLTAMFGEGHEPTIEQFKKWFPCDYYPYNAGEYIGLNTGPYVNYNQAGYYDTATARKATATMDTDGITRVVTPTANYGGIAQQTNYKYTHAIAGHKYYMSAEVRLSDANANVYLGETNTSSAIRSGYRVQAEHTTDWQTISFLIPNYAANTNYKYFGVVCSNATTVNNSPFYVRGYRLIDLTLMFGVGNEPATTTEFELLYPQVDYSEDRSEFKFLKGFIENGKLIPQQLDSGITIDVWGSTMFDCSGYENNGTVVGTLTTSSNTPRYNICTEFNGNNYIAIGKQLYNIKDAISVNIWAFKSDWSVNTGTFFSSVQTGGYGWQVNGANYTVYVGTGTTSNTYVSKALTTNNLSSGWHMFSFTYNGQILTIYIDGVSKGSVTRSSAAPLFYPGTSGMFVGAESNGSEWTSSTDRFIGKISDLRIYATSLSSNQILDLYKTSGYYIRNGLMAYEFIEPASSNINKKGIMTAPEFIEKNGAIDYDTLIQEIVNSEFYKDKTISNNFIEI